MAYIKFLEWALASLPEELHYSGRYAHCIYMRFRIHFQYVCAFVSELFLLAEKRRCFFEICLWGVVATRDLSRRGVFNLPILFFRMQAYNTYVCMLIYIYIYIHVYIYIFIYTYIAKKAHIGCYIDT
jgi:hypothetical protein